MHSADEARAMVRDRGPRYAVCGSLRPHEARAFYADTAEQAEAERDRLMVEGYYNVQLHPPVGAVDLTALGAGLRAARLAVDEATSLARAGVVRALEEGRSESEVARSLGVDRMTVRKWAGK